MMKKTLLTLTFLCFVLFGCKAQQSNKYQDFISSVLSYQTNTDVIRAVDNMKIDSSTFNINDYFKLFDLLSIEEGYKLDYHYWYYGAGGNPQLVMLEKEGTFDSLKNNFYRENQEIKSIQEITNFGYADTDSMPIYFDFTPINFIRYADSVLNPLPHIHIDDSEMGYFQYLVFHLIGDNFCLFWHSSYKKLHLICSENTLHNIIQTTDLSRKEKKRAKRIDVLPYINLEKDTCYIRVVQFNDWDGFIEKTFSISRRFPHSITTMSENVLVEYWCGIMF